MIPPVKKAHPSTKSIFDKMEPNNDCWTTLIIPFFNAYIDIIISVALPNVALRRPPTADAIRNCFHDTENQRLKDYNKNPSNR